MYCPTCGKKLDDENDCLFCGTGFTIIEDEMGKYIISNITEKNLDIIKKALDLYCRIGIGQIEEVDNVIRCNESYFTHLNSLDQTSVNEAKYYLNLYKKIMTGFDLGASFSIASPGVNQQFKEAYSMYNVLDGREGLKLNNEPSIIKIPPKF